MYSTSKYAVRPMLDVVEEKDLARNEFGAERRVERVRKDGGGDPVLRVRRQLIRRGTAIFQQGSMRGNGSRDCERLGK